MNEYCRTLCNVQYLQHGEAIWYYGPGKVVAASRLLKEVRVGAAITCCGRMFHIMTDDGKNESPK